MSGQNGPPMLANTQFCMDWGYWLPSLLYTFFTPSGADVLGTIKRCPMFPFTYEQKLAQSDTQKLIDTHGFKALFIKQLSMRDKQLTGIAYWDGRWGVTLGLKSSISTRHWDLVVANPLDAKQHVQWFQVIESAEDEDDKQLFILLPVKALTTKQNTPEWFLLRTYSFTSSTSDNCF